MAYIGQSLTEGTRRVYTYVATASQTTFNAVYGVGAVDVYQYGILLAPSDYTASDGTTVVLGVGAAFQDEITIVCHNTFSVADTVSASQGGTFNQPVTIDGNGTTVLTVDRATSDGMVLDVQKNGTSVGGISTVFDALHLNANADFGVKIASVSSGAFQYVAPVNQATSGSIVYDGQVNLGLSISRFKDLYLSGGVYLGGTGAANKLDDYEEGTFTPTFSTASTYYSQVGIYTKIGNVVTIGIQLDFLQSGSTFGGIGSLPFTISTINYAGISTREYYSTGNFFVANLAVGGTGTSSFYNPNNSPAATSGQRYGFSLTFSYQT